MDEREEQSSVLQSSETSQGRISTITRKVLKIVLPLFITTRVHIWAPPLKH